MLRFVIVPFAMAILVVFIWLSMGHFDRLLPWDRSLSGFALGLVLVPLASVYAIAILRAGCVSYQYPSKAKFARSENPFGYWLSVLFILSMVITCTWRVVSQVIAWIRQ
jgi:hypothetical protein